MLKVDEKCPFAYDLDTEFQHARSYADAGLVDSALRSVGLILSKFPVHDRSNAPVHFEILFLYANCLQENGEHRRAMTYYHRTLAVLRGLRSIGQKSTEYLKKDYQVREKYAQSCMRTQDLRMAKSLLEAIPETSRRTQVWSALADIYEQMREISSAIVCHKAIIKQYPQATEPFLALLRLKVPREEVEQLLSSQSDWSRLYVTAHQDRWCQEYKKAKEGFKTLERFFKNNVDLCVNIAECEMETGQDLQALYLLESIRSSDPDNVVACDKYAGLLREQGKATAVNDLAQTVFSIADDRPECWLVLAHYSELKGDKEKALFYVNTAVEMAPMYAEAHYLKGILLQRVASADNSQNKPEVKTSYFDALKSFRKAFELAPSMLCSRGIIECQLALGQGIEATQTALSLVKAHPDNPQAMVLFGKTKMDDEDREKREMAKRAFKRAISLDAKCTEAVLNLSEVLEKEQDFQGAIAVLEEHMDAYPKEALLCRVAQLYLSKRQTLPPMPPGGEDLSLNKAYDLFTEAQHINSEYEPANLGLERVQRLITGEDEEEDDVNDDPDYHHSENRSDDSMGDEEEEY
ncbi:hypothetical protein SmJEL517_g00229 [Synchytrium microbalum]|uniref:Anaphase-promoting complex subunit 7 n=1 Tax=Synchytrium microbalum TaxID=1806994 RepID=A0A507CFC5_9FUNG|nr:uncharacterized protein SmJEL517_g00229 [Synchytrium microbalum]TPX38201.1 hypothetical protein SmJEL517_g00229 [Synchytrium microbalum]